MTQKYISEYVEVFGEPDEARPRIGHMLYIWKLKSNLTLTILGKRCEDQSVVSVNKNTVR